MSLFGIDISEHQGDINIAALKGQVDYIILRAGWAETVDKKFEKNYALCKQHGIPVGAYWYSYALTISDAVSEANCFINHMEGKQFEYPVYLDMEDADHWKTKNGYDFVNTRPISEKFCEIVQDAGYYVGIYAAKSWLDNYLAGLQNKYTGWVAHWGANDGNVNIDYSNSSYHMHQYSSSVRLNGYGGNLDANLSFVDFPSIIINGGFNGFSHGSTETPPQAPETSPVAPSVSKYKVGDHVKFSSCFFNSVDAASCNPSLTVQGMLTDNGVVSEILSIGGVTVYNLSNICWVNDGDIRGYYGSTPQSITVGSKVVVTNAVDINGNSLWVNGTYDVIQIDGIRVVIGKGKEVTAAIHIENIKLA